MKRILSVISGNIESGGVEVYLKNAYENMCREDLEIDILVPGRIVFKPYADSFKNMGCNLLIMNIPQENGYRYLKLYKAVDKTLKRKAYDLIHVNTGNITIQAIVLNAAVRNRVPERVSHSHGTLYKGGRIKEFIKDIMRKSVNHNATQKLACSELAAISLFGEREAKKTIIARNGIRVDEYRFDEAVRQRIRAENDWSGRFVVGSVGRLAPEKNYEFVLKVFSELYKIDPNSLLVLVGDGEERRKLEVEAEKLSIRDHIEFMGNRDDVSTIMQGMDVFILASKREALGIVNIEAQATGLHCVISDMIPSEVDITGNVSFLSLNDPISKWVDVLLGHRKKARFDYTGVVRANGYDLLDAYSIIDKLYHYNL